MTTRRTLLLFVIALGVAVPGAARADDYVGTTTTTATTSTTRPSTTTTTIAGTTLSTGATSTTIAGTVITQSPPPGVLGEQVRRPSAFAGLALTGTDILGITALAAALLAVGLGLVIRARRPVA